MKKKFEIPAGRMPIGDPDELIAEAAKIVGPHDPAEVEAFAARLCGLGGLSRDGMLESIRGLMVPTDFPHLRITNLNRGQWVREVISSYQAQLELRDLMVDLSCSVDSEIRNFHPDHVWHETVALPIVNPGMLELGIRFRPRQPSDVVEYWRFGADHFQTVVYGLQTPVPTTR